MFVIDSMFNYIKLRETTKDEFQAIFKVNVTNYKGLPQQIDQELDLAQESNSWLKTISLSDRGVLVKGLCYINERSEPTQLCKSRHGEIVALEHDTASNKMIMLMSKKKKKDELAVQAGDIYEFSTEPEDEAE